MLVNKIEKIKIESMRPKSDNNVTSNFNLCRTKLCEEPSRGVKLDNNARLNNLYKIRGKYGVSKKVATAKKAKYVQKYIREFVVPVKIG